MTREGIAKHRAVFDAWMNGADVELFNVMTDKWMDDDTPQFHDDRMYRIKPAAEKPQYTHEQILSRWWKVRASWYKPAYCYFGGDGEWQYMLDTVYRAGVLLKLESAEMPHE